MKTILFLCALLIVLTPALAQETASPAPATKPYKKDHKVYREEGAVLRDNQKLKQGPYVAVGRSWQVKGQYSQGKPVGVWSYFGREGKLNGQYDFSARQYVQQPTTGFAYSKDLKVWTDGQFVAGKVDQDPFFVLGEAGLLSFIVINTRYPIEASRAGQSGKVLLSAEITETGELVNERVVRGFGYGSEEAALQVLRMVPDEWEPAQIDGKPVRTKITIPISFTVTSSNSSHPSPSTTPFGSYESPSRS